MASVSHCYNIKKSRKTLQCNVNSILEGIIGGMASKYTHFEAVSKINKIIAFLKMKRKFKVLNTSLMTLMV